MSQPPPPVPGHGLLDGLGVVITAAAGSGIGSSTARRCLEEGARVVISDRHERRLAETAAELGVTGIPCDVTDEASVQALVAAAAAELGSIDVLVNNAGLGGTAELHEMTDEQWSMVLDVTLNGTFRVNRAACR
jgi:3-oxoacyl-[acyl-carrier protein] reductase